MPRQIHELIPISKELDEIIKTIHFADPPRLTSPLRRVNSTDAAKDILNNASWIGGIPDNTDASRNIPDTIGGVTKVPSTTDASHLYNSSS